MQQLNIFERKTHKFADGWACEDRHDWVCALKLTPPRVTFRAYDLDESDTYVQYARIPAGAGPRERSAVLNAIHDTMGGSNCRHDYDCCGCATRYAHAKFTSKRDILIHTRVVRNY